MRHPKRVSKRATANGGLLGWPYPPPPSKGLLKCHRLNYGPRKEVLQWSSMTREVIKYWLHGPFPFPFFFLFTGAQVRRWGEGRDRWSRWERRAVARYWQSLAFFMSDTGITLSRVSYEPAYVIRDRISHLFTHFSSACNGSRKSLHASRDNPRDNETVASLFNDWTGNENYVIRDDKPASRPDCFIDYAINSRYFHHNRYIMAKMAFDLWKFFDDTFFWEERKSNEKAMSVQWPFRKTRKMVLIRNMHTVDLDFCNFNCAKRDIIIPWFKKYCKCLEKFERNVFSVSLFFF